MINFFKMITNTNLLYGFQDTNFAVRKDQERSKIMLLNAYSRKFATK